MNLKSKLSRLPHQIQKLIKAVSVCAQKGNFKAYLVGGIVRDLLLGRVNFDLDIVIEGDALKFAELLSKYLNTEFRRHHSFGTATVLSSPYKIDLATSRREFYPHWGALPKVERSSLFEDLKRRDFTINALALSLNRNNFGKLVDYFDGFSDLRKGIIRILHKDSFLEDPTRILRAIRFKERFNFKFASQTSRELKKALEKKALRWVSFHRLRDELELILKEEEPLKVIRSLDKIGVFTFLGIGSLKREDYFILRKIKRSLLWYKENFPRKRCLDEWIVYLIGLFRRVSLRKTKVIIGKLGFRRGDRIRLITSKKVKVLSKLSERISPSCVYKMLESFSFEVIIFFYSLTSSKLAKENIREFLDRFSEVRLTIKGRDLQKLGISPPTIYGKILKKLLYKKIDGKITSKEEELQEARKFLKIK